MNFAEFSVKVADWLARKVPVIGPHVDKVLHAAGGLAIYGAARLALPSTRALLIVMVIGLLKEAWDAKHPPHEADGWDAVATVAPAMVWAAL